MTKQQSANFFERKAKFKQAISKLGFSPTVLKKNCINGPLYESLPNLLYWFKNEPNKETILLHRGFFKTSLFPPSIKWLRLATLSMDAFYDRLILTYFTFEKLINSTIYASWRIKTGSIEKSCQNLLYNSGPDFALDTLKWRLAPHWPFGYQFFQQKRVPVWRIQFLPHNSFQSSSGPCSNVLQNQNLCQKCGSAGWYRNSSILGRQL